MKKIALIILLVISCTYSSSLTLKGKVAPPMMAIGGETTGLALILQDGETVELLYKQKLKPGETLKVKGHFIELEGPERGKRKVFKVEEILKD